jgi:hypothetical protein
MWLHCFGNSKAGVAEALPKIRIPTSPRNLVSVNTLGRAFSVSWGVARRLV